MSPAAVAFASACSALAPLVVGPTVVAGMVVVAGETVVVVAPERPPDPHPAIKTATVPAR
jgi:hypothetical protein